MDSKTEFHQESQGQNDARSDCCVLCGSSAPAGVARAANLRRLRQQIERTRDLVLRLPPLTNATNERSDNMNSRRVKNEDVEADLQEAYAEGDIRSPELQYLRRELENTDSLRKQRQGEFSQKDAKFGAPKAKYQGVGQQLHSLRETLSVDKNAVRADLFATKQLLAVTEAEKQRLSYSVQKMEVEIKTLKERLLEDVGTERGRK